jgi:peptidoglycan-N-acetylglucosamine deacetylase
MPRLVRWIVGVWEEAFTWGVGARPIPGGTGAFRWVQQIYQGPQVRLRDGTRVTPGVCILELHIANTRLQDYTCKPAATCSYLWTLSRACTRDLKALATAAREGQLPDFAALYGLTSMAPGARRLGFELLPAPDHLGTTIIAWWQRMLTRVFHPTGRYRHRGKRRRPMMVWMSYVALLELYGHQAKDLSP